MAFPNVRAYDPAYAYEISVVVLDGLKKLYEDGDTAIYYLTTENENYEMPAMPEGVEEGIVRGIYRLSTVESEGDLRVQLFGSGAILRSVLAAQKIMAERYNISSDVWSVTSYSELRRDAQTCERWNMLHPAEPRRQSYIETELAESKGPFIAASDYVRAVPEQLQSWIPGDYFVLGTDGMGRSETRERLRRHFEVDAECVTIAALYRLARLGQIDVSLVDKAIQDLDVDPEKINPLYA
jgi:pyruvate dehydrogenase E1 component